MEIHIISSHPKAKTELPYISYVTIFKHVISKILLTSAVLHSRNPSEHDYNNVLVLLEYLVGSPVQNLILAKLTTPIRK